MIETIFYFANRQADYDSNFNANNINTRTISFVPKNSKQGNIYKAGVRYGGVDTDLDYEAIKSVVKAWINGNDSDKPNFPSGGDGGSGGTTIIENPYDDQWIHDAIEEFEQRAEDEKNRVKEYINDKDLDIRNLIEHMFSDYEDIIQHYIDTGDPNYQEYTFGDPESMEWISKLGTVTDNGNGTYSVDWSSILQTVSSLKGEVDQIKASAGAGGFVDYNLLSSALYAYIEDNYTTSGMSSTWAKVLDPNGGFDEDTHNVLEWMASDVKTWANNQQAYSEAMAAAREYDETGKTVLQEAAAGLNALVEKQPDGTYKASTTLSSLVSDDVDTKLASLQLETLDDEAIASLYAHMDSEIEGKTAEAISGIESRVKTVEEAGYIKSTEAQNIITSKVNNATSGLATKTYVDNSVSNTESSMNSKINNVSASVATKVTKTNGRIESGVTIYGDQVEITGTHKLNLTADDINLTASSLVNIISSGNAKIAAKNLDLSGVTTTVYADDIVMNASHKLALTSDNFSIDGSVLAAKLGSASVTTDKIDITGLSNNQTLINALNSKISVNSLTAGTGGKTVTVDSNGVVVSSGSTVAANLKSDGSGSIANGAITWTSNGTISGIGSGFKTKLEDELTLKKLTVTNGSNIIYINPTDGIKQTISGTTKNQIAQNGSGSLAGGNISWTTAGATTIKGTFTTGDSGYQWKMSPGSIYASLDLSNGSSTPVSLSGNSSNGGWLKLYNPSDSSYVYLYGTTLRFVTSDGSSDDGINISYNKGINQPSVQFGKSSSPNSSWWGSDNFMQNVIKYNSDISIRTEARSSGATITVTDASGINTIGSTGQSASSDMRLKDVIANKELTAEQIADAPIFTYTPKTNPDANPIIGTSAQYWQEVLPEAVSEINEYLALDYTKVAITSVINLAKEVVILKTENTSLRERVEALEARLQLIENKLNA